MSVRDGEMLILKGHEVSSLLAGQENVLIEIVQRAYETHARGDSSLPHSTFLRFPDKESNRIIALPAYLGKEFGIAGVKWVSSFPENLDRGMDRASAVVVLNSSITGRPEAFIEGSIISAKRTAASAALAAQSLHADDDDRAVGIIGAGFINFEIVKALLASRPEKRSFMIFDTVMARSEQFKNKCLETFEQVEISTERDINKVLKECPLISFATTASKPYVSDLSASPPDTTILHISLRDLSPEVILSCDNVVDDISHACRASTSLHLAEQLVGHREFIRCTLADILLGISPIKKNGSSRVVFSPFGLGVLDLAVGKYVYDLALQHGMGTSIGEFFPASWIERN